MKLFDFEKQYVFTTKIFVGDDKQEYVVMREPTTQEMAGFGDDNKKNLDIVMKILPDCIVDSSFTDENDNPVVGKPLANFLEKSGTKFSEFVSEWVETFTSRSQKKGK